YGLIISDITNPFFPELVKSFEDVAVQYGQEVLIANTDYDKHRTEQCVIRMLQRKVDGVAIMTSEMDEHLITEFSSRKIPLVFLDTGTVQKGISNIAIDYAAGIDEAVTHLREFGHEEIGFISGPPNLTSARVRRKAFLASMKRKGLSPGKELIEEGNHRMDGGYAAMARLLRKQNRPTAVLASNDMSAIGALGAILEHGLKVPRDISVIGFDDIAMSEYTQPPLTTVRLSRTEIAKLAFRAPRHSERRYSKGGGISHRAYAGRAQEHRAGSSLVLPLIFSPRFCIAQGMHSFPFGLQWSARKRRATEDR